MASCYTAEAIICTDRFDPDADVNAMFDDLNESNGFFSLVVNTSSHISNF